MVKGYSAKLLGPLLALHRIDYAVKLRILILNSRLHRLPMSGTECHSMFSLHSKYYAGEWVGTLLSGQEGSGHICAI